MKKLKLTEDWTAVVIGLIMLLLVAAANFFPEMPKFGPKEGWSGWTVLSKDVFTTGNTMRLVATFFYFFLFAVAGAFLMRKNIKSLLIAFPLVFILSMLAQFIASSGSMKNLGFETVLFSLLIGLFISNVLKTPKWLKEGIQSEFYIKAGLVLLGATILFAEIMKAGVYGLVQAIIVVLAVWYFAFWIARKFKVDDELSAILASAVSICGVSAAIATAGAIKGDSKKLSYTISLVLVVAIPMMIFMPLLAKWIGLTPAVTGAWLGGSVDTTAAVAAAGTIAGKEALDIATIVKFSQNILLGVAAFLIAILWTFRQAANTTNAEKPTARVIWERFPKFVLGFIFASLLFSFFINPDTVKASQPVIKSYQSLWFNLAFVCIGLETRFKDLVSMEKGRPLWAFLIAQTFNILLTLVVAYILFGMLYQ